MSFEIAFLSEFTHANAAGELRFYATLSQVISKATFVLVGLATTSRTADCIFVVREFTV